MKEKIVVKRGEKLEKAHSEKSDANILTTKETRKRLFVHIGMFKTGSTSIQYFLNDNGYRLFDEGILYPTSGRHSRSNVQHQLVAEAFSDRIAAVGDFKLTQAPNRDIILTALRHEIDLSGKNNVIISAEAFSGYNDEEVVSFGREFADFEIYPIVFIRNYADLADASYQTQIMTNAAKHSFEAAGLENINLYYNVHDMGVRWSRIGHEGRIVILNFDDTEHRDVVQKFAKALKLNRDKYVFPAQEARSNKSVSPTQVVIKQYLSAHINKLDAIDELMIQLAKLETNEKQTYLSQEARDRLNEAYLKDVTGLIGKKLADADEFDMNKLKSFIERPMIKVNNIVNALFAIGRAASRIRR